MHLKYCFADLFKLTQNIYSLTWSTFHKLHIYTVQVGSVAAANRTSGKK